MIAVNVSNQNEVGRRQAIEIGRLRGIEVDGFAGGFDEEAGVVDGSDFHGAGAGLEGLRLARGLSLRGERDGHGSGGKGEEKQFSHF